MHQNPLRPEWQKPSGLTGTVRRNPENPLLVIGAMEDDEDNPEEYEPRDKSCDGVTRFLLIVAALMLIVSCLLVIILPYIQRK